MTTKVLKAVLVGLLAGALLFFMPFFLFRILAVILMISIVLRLSGFRRRWRYGSHSFFNNPAYMQRWCSMSDAERKTFQEKMERELFAGTSTQR